MKLLLQITVVAMLLWSAGTRGEQSGRVELTRLTLGEIGGWLELPVEVNNQTGRWLLDTGSSRNLVSAAFSTLHALETGSSVIADTATGQMKGAEVSLPALKVGSLEQHNQTALVVDLKRIAGTAAQGLQGVLGVPFLKGLELELDLRTWSMNLRRGADQACPQGTSAMALELHQGLPVIELRINSGKAESFLFDSGNPAGLIRFLASVPSDLEPAILLPGHARLNLAQRVSIDKQTRLNVPVVQLYAPTLKQALGRRIVGLAGTAMLDGARLQLDLARRRLCVEPGSFSVPGGFGLTLKQNGGDISVATVLPGGPAQAAGLRQGDIIKRWAGGSAEDSLQELWSRVQGLEEIELVVGDEALAVRLRRAYFAPPLR